MHTRETRTVKSGDLLSILLLRVELHRGIEWNTIMFLSWIRTSAVLLQVLTTILSILSTMESEGISGTVVRGTEIRLINRSSRGKVEASLKKVIICAVVRSSQHHSLARGEEFFPSYYSHPLENFCLGEENIRLLSFSCMSSPDP